MTTLKITLYKNIKSVFVLVNHHFRILGGKKRWGGGGGVNLMSGQNFFSQQILTFFHKDIDDNDDECYDFQEQILRMSRDN